MKDQGSKIVIVAGGTGGHLFPGIATAEAIKELDPHSSITFLITGRPFEIEALERRGLEYLIIKSKGIKGLGPISQAKAVLSGLWGTMRLCLFFKATKPDVVLGMGAYLSGPAGIAAKLTGSKLAIHEQNSYPGLTNRLLFRMADRVFISFEETKDYFKEGRLAQKESQIKVTGNPIRSSLLKKAMEPWERRDECILILGGSQGAKVLNEVALKSFDILKNSIPLPHIIHITGTPHFESIVDGYRRIGVKGEVYPYREDMEELYNRVTLAISRAGAGSIFELAYFGIPAILVPYPYAANRHQHLNALSFCKGGAGILLDQRELTPESLSRSLLHLLSDKKRLQHLSEAARRFARPDSASLIAMELLSLSKEKR